MARHVNQKVRRVNGTVYAANTENLIRICPQLRITSQCSVIIIDTVNGAQDKVQAYEKNSSNLMDRVRNLEIIWKFSPPSYLGSPVTWPDKGSLMTAGRFLRALAYETFSRINRPVNTVVHNISGCVPANSLGDLLLTFSGIRNKCWDQVMGPLFQNGLVAGTSVGVGGS